MSEKWREAIQRGDKEEERKWGQERKEAKEEFDKAKAEAEKAKEELEKAQSSQSTAPFLAGGAFALLHVQLLLFARSTVFTFWGHALLSARISSWLSFTVLACSPSGSGRGSWLLQVQANLVALRVLPTLQNGVSVLGSRWGGQPVSRSSCARSPDCGWSLFEARRSGYFVREGEVKGVNPWVLSACL